MSALAFETTRIVARPVRPEDRDACLDTLRRSTLSPREAHGDFLTLSQLGPEAFPQMLARRAAWAERDEHHVLGLFLAEGGAFVGDTLLFDIDRARHARAEIGLVLHSPFRGRGLGPECLAGTVAWGFRALRLEEVYGYVEEGNEQSRVACLRAGFRLLTSQPVTRAQEGGERRVWPISARR